MHVNALQLHARSKLSHYVPRLLLAGSPGMHIGKKKGLKALQEVRMCSEAALAAEPIGSLYFYVLVGEGQSEDHKCHFFKQLILPLMSS